MVECGVMFDWFKERLRCNMAEGHEEPHAHESTEVAGKQYDDFCKQELDKLDLGYLTMPSTLKTDYGSCALYRRDQHGWELCVKPLSHEDDHKFLESRCDDIQQSMLDMILDHRAAKEELEPGSEKLKKILESKRDELRRYLAGVMPRAKGCLEVYGLYSDNKGDYCYICNKPPGHTGQHDGEKTNFTSIVKRMKAIQKVEKGIAKYEKQEKEKQRLADIAECKRALRQHWLDYQQRYFGHDPSKYDNVCLTTHLDNGVKYLCFQEIGHKGACTGVQCFSLQAGLLLNTIEILELEGEPVAKLQQTIADLKINPPELCGQKFLDIFQNWIECEKLKDHKYGHGASVLARQKGVKQTPEDKKQIDEEYKKKFPMLCEKRYHGDNGQEVVCTLIKGHESPCDVSINYDEAYRLKRQQSIEEDRAEIKAKLVAEMEAKGIPGKQKGTGFTNLTEAQISESLEDRLINKFEPGGFEKVVLTTALGPSTVNIPINGNSYEIKQTGSTKDLIHKDFIVAPGVNSFTVKQEHEGTTTIKLPKSYVPEYASGRTIDGDSKISHEPPVTVELFQCLQETNLLVDVCVDMAVYYLSINRPVGDSKQNLIKAAYLLDLAKRNYPENK